MAKTKHKSDTRLNSDFRENSFWRQTSLLDSQVLAFNDDILRKMTQFLEKSFREYFFPQHFLAATKL